MFTTSSWTADLASGGAGVVVGILGMLGTLKAALVTARAVEYSAVTRRLSELEVRADQMVETIYRKDRQLIDALEDAANAKAAAERAEGRSDAAERRAEELEDRCRKLEQAFNEFINRTRMPASERERIRELCRQIPSTVLRKETVANVS